MLKEFFESLWTKAQWSMRPAEVTLSREPGHRYAIAHADGKLEYREAEPQPRQHKAGDLTAIIDWAKKSHGDTECDDEPIIWFSREAVTLFLHDGTRRDVVKLLLQFHPQLKTLQMCEAKPEWLDQKPFISFLRIKLADCIREDSEGDVIGLIETLRRIKFRKNEQGHSEIAHSKASIGRALECELTGVGVIPERIAVTVPIFAGPLHFLAHPVNCAIEVDAASEKFQLVPLPGEVENAVCLAEADIGRELAEALADKVPVYYGTP